MARDIPALREELDKLSPNQKAELARTLIDSLDEDLDEAVEQLWLNFLSAEFGQAPLWAGGRQARGVSA